MHWKVGLYLIVLAAITWSCQPTNPNYQEDINDAAYFHESMKKLSDVIVYDIFSPPVASRIYAYASIAGYEALQPDYPEQNTLSGQISGLEPLPQPEEGQVYCHPLASLHAFLKVGKALTFSEDKMDAYQEELYQRLDSIHVPEDVWDRSLLYGEAVADHILAWADKDMYKQTRTYPKFSINDDPARWQPTPPDYMDGIEPHWREIRTLVLESPQQFTPPPPTEFSTEKDSKFMQETMEVYNALAVADTAEQKERKNVAKFWDCNPYVSHHTGHVMFATKKITPGGHWIGITEIVCKQDDASLVKSVEAYTLTSIALFDAFISCWDEKYRSNLIRPETVINKYIDEDWVPALQTPPFPEHTSGHSVISRAAAVALTSIFGDNFAFNDTTEEEYGLPARQFRSFYHASDEAAVSRLYGGIHYRPAIEYGVAQGEKVGKYIVEELQLKQQLSSK
ncbi:MAG: vanadium-dependent haloperoxidase [Phaeodactylibacter sp.]|uniref:vanadium-dependent haloperoxidase n=1 Tax=Phaeodactylibacter sp. TaxID=1940289 RepID=UPI0032F09991